MARTRRRATRRWAAGALAIAAGWLAPPVLAQVPDTIPTPFKNEDANGVDLTEGTYTFSFVAGTIGSGDNALPLVHSFDANVTDNLATAFRRTESGGTATIVLVFGNRSETFTGATTATSFTPAQGNGATLEKLADAPGEAGRDRYLYTDAEGVETLYTWPGNFAVMAENGIFCGSKNDFSCTLLPQTTIWPSGRTLAWSHEAHQDCTPDGEQYQCIEYFRPTSVASNAGYSIAFAYVTDDVPQGEQPPSACTGARRRPSPTPRRAASSP